MISLRLVLDTNIPVSAMLNEDGLPRTIVRLATHKPIRLYVSEAILHEYRIVFSRPELRIRKGLRQHWLQVIRNIAEIVEPKVLLDVAKDPADNKSLECADAARADYLITGNLKDFPKLWKKTKIIASREFLTLMAPHLLRRS